jgi:hypothetical protein
MNRKFYKGGSLFSTVNCKHLAVFKTFLYNHISCFENKRHNLILYLKESLDSDDKDYIKIKIALSRLIPLWQKILPDNNGT